MPRTLSVSLAAAATLTILATAVFWAGDRQTVVPPPEAVGEQLLRQLHAHREVRTEQLLADSVKSEWPPRQLRDWWIELEHQVGEVEQITGAGNVIDGDRAEARVEVQGRAHSADVRLQIQREHGLWVVAQLPPTVSVGVRGGRL